MRWFPTEKQAEILKALVTLGVSILTSDPSIETIDGVDEDYNYILTLDKDFFMDSVDCPDVDNFRVDVRIKELLAEK